MRLLESMSPVVELRRKQLWMTEDTFEMVGSNDSQSLGDPWLMNVASSSARDTGTKQRDVSGTF